MKSYQRTTKYKNGIIDVVVVLDDHFRQTVITTTAGTAKFVRVWVEERVDTDRIKYVINQQHTNAMNYIDELPKLTPEELILLNAGFSLSPDSTTI